MIPSALFTDTFTIKKTEQSVSAIGKVTHKVRTVSVGNKGRIVSISGSRSRDFMGSIADAGFILYCQYNSCIEFGMIIENEETCEQYDIVRVDNKKFYGSRHHMQIMLDLRATSLT